jgi:hypothetical protein
MCRQCLALVILLLAPAAVLPQRYGRPYTLAESGPLYLQIKVQDKSHYVSPWELQKMPRSAVTLIDPATKAPHVYEGVALDRLAPGMAAASGAGSIQIDFGSHQTLTLSETDLDPGTEPIVVDTVDGKPLPGHVPYYLLEKSRGKPLEKFTDVRCITVKPSA